MGVLRPVKMAKVGLLGLKQDRPAILTALHDLRVAQVEPVAPERLKELSPERGSELQRRVAEQALRFRGLKSALPSLPGGAPRRFDSLDEVFALAATVPIDEEVGQLRREDDQLVSKEKGLDDTAALLERMRRFDGRLESLRGRSFLTLLAEAGPKSGDAWRARLAAEPKVGVQPLAEDRSGWVGLVTVPRESVETTARALGTEGVRLTVLPERLGTVAEAEGSVRADRDAAVERRREIAQRLEEISREWFATVASLDEALQVESRLFDVFPKLAASASAFALEAWVPVRDLGRFRTALENVSGGRTFVYPLPITEEPPTLMENPPGIQWFEFFIRFYSLPRASEWDPTLVFAIIFPIFFGFMIADWGYGLVILLLALWMIVGFPGARHLPKALGGFARTMMTPSGLQRLAKTLVPGAIVAIAFGIYFDAFFGYTLLHATVGYSASIRPDTDLSQLLLLSGYIGLAMVTLGFLMGSLQQFFLRHYRGGIGKAGGIVTAWGITLFGLSVIRHMAGAPLESPYLWMTIAGAITFVVGSGLEHGLLGLIEVVSHILSYTRLIGILLASVILAELINAAAVGYFHSGGVLILLGVVILLIGQTFNVVLSVFEPSIQGMRLLYVEYFSKFFEGNGHEFHPFGADRAHTLPIVEKDGRVTAPPPGGPAPTTAG